MIYSSSGNVYNSSYEFVDSQHQFVPWKLKQSIGFKSIKTDESWRNMQWSLSYIEWSVIMPVLLITTKHQTKLLFIIFPPFSKYRRRKHPILKWKTSVFPNAITLFQSVYSHVWWNKNVFFIEFVPSASGVCYLLKHGVITSKMTKRKKKAERLRKPHKSKIT